MTTKMKVVQKSNEPEVATEVIAQAIIEISEAMKKLKNSRLKERAIIILIKRACPSWVTEVQVKAVLTGIADLEKEFIR